MSANASRVAGHRHLRLVASSLAPVAPPDADTSWRRVAVAILASTWNVSRYLREQRWSRVQEEISERRELLGYMSAMNLDAIGRSALRALDEAAIESERAIATMLGENR